MLGAGGRSRLQCDDAVMRQVERHAWGEVVREGLLISVPGGRDPSGRPWSCWRCSRARLFCFDARAVVPAAADRGRAGMESCDRNRVVIVELGEPSSLARGPGRQCISEEWVRVSVQAWPLALAWRLASMGWGTLHTACISRVEHNKLPHRAHNESHPTSITRTPHPRHETKKDSQEPHPQTQT